MSLGRVAADLFGMTTPALAPASLNAPSTVYAAARSRAHGPTAALWHAVEVHRPSAEVDGACELTVCGALARIAPDATWPIGAGDVCPACCTLAR
jgi:hypothetical protein